jgi:hypothetical protein
MSSQVPAVIAELKDMAQQGILTAYELDWCLGAIRNRMGLTRETRHRLRDTVHQVLKVAKTRYENETRL